MGLSGLTRHGTAESNSRDQTLGRNQGRGKLIFPFDAQYSESDDTHTREATRPHARPRIILYPSFSSFQRHFFELMSSIILPLYALFTLQRGLRSSTPARIWVPSSHRIPQGPRNIGVRRKSVKRGRLLKVPSNATLSQLRCLIPSDLGCESPDAQRETKPSSAKMRGIRGSIFFLGGIGGIRRGLLFSTDPNNYKFAVLPVVRKIIPSLLRSRLAVVF